MSEQMQRPVMSDDEKNVLRAGAIRGNPQFYSAIDRAWAEKILAVVASLPEGASAEPSEPAADPVEHDQSQEQ